MRVIKDNCYGFHCKSGDLIVYGNNIKICRPYIDNLVFNCVEDLCDYCSQHNLRVWHKHNCSLNGLFEIFRVRRLTKKYSVYSSWKELKQYLDNTQ